MGVDRNHRTSVRYLRMHCTYVCTVLLDVIATVLYCTVLYCMYRALTFLRGMMPTRSWLSALRYDG